MQQEHASQRADHRADVSVGIAHADGIQDVIAPRAAVEVADDVPGHADQRGQQKFARMERHGDDVAHRDLFLRGFIGKFPGHKIKQQPVHEKQNERGDPQGDDDLGLPWRTGQGIRQDGSRDGGARARQGAGQVEEREVNVPVRPVRQKIDVPRHRPRTDQRVRGMADKQKNAEPDGPHGMVRDEYRHDRRREDDVGIEENMVENQQRSAPLEAAQELRGQRAEDPRDIGDEVDDAYPHDVDSVGGEESGVERAGNKDVRNAGEQRIQQQHAPARRSVVAEVEKPGIVGVSPFRSQSRQDGVRPFSKVRMRLVSAEAPVFPRDRSAYSGRERAGDPGRTNRFWTIISAAVPE